jgi:DNA-binding IclR family transcriptional regulator
VLEEIRDDGFYVGSQDLDPGIIGIAAPVLDHRGAVAGAIAVSAPVSRMTESDIPAFIRLILDACRKTSCQLGYVDPPVGPASRPQANSHSSQLTASKRGAR